MPTTAIAISTHRKQDLFQGYPGPCWLRDGGRIIQAAHFDQLGVSGDPEGRTLAELFGEADEFSFRRDDTAVLAGRPAQHRCVLGGAFWAVTLWAVEYRGKMVIAGLATRLDA